MEIQQLKEINIKLSNIIINYEEIKDLLMDVAVNCKCRNSSKLQSMDKINKLLILCKSEREKFIKQCDNIKKIESCKEVESNLLKIVNLDDGDNCENYHHHNKGNHDGDDDDDHIGDENSFYSDPGYELSNSNSDYSIKVKKSKKGTKPRKSKRETPGTHPCTWPGCDQIFRYKSSLRGHFTRHTAKEEDVKCKMCGKVFIDKYGLKAHIKQTHSVEKRLKCYWPGCDFETNFNNSFNKHKLKHTGVRMFSCDWPDCGKRFKTKPQVQLHMRCHTNEKPYHCHVLGCGRSYTKNYTLKKHLQKIHSII